MPNHDDLLRRLNGGPLATNAEYVGEFDSESSTRRTMNVTCPNCSSANVTRRVVRDAFPYGGSADTVQLTADLPVQHCNTCGEEWENDETFRARHEARGLYRQIDAALAKKRK